MANKIQIKHGSGVPGGGKLSSFELGYATQTGQLYISTTGSNILGITPASHSHAWSEVTSKPAQATRWPTWSEVTSKPDTATRWPTWSEVTSKPSNSQFPSTSEAIGASKNLNDYTTPGFYYQSANASAASGSNYPIAEAGTLIVTRDAGTTQMYYHYNGSGVYYRTFYNSTWTAWKNIAKPPWSEVTSKPTTATRWPTWSEVTSKPSTFAPSTHAHTGTRTTGDYTDHSTQSGTIFLGPMNTAYNHILSSLNVPYWFDKDVKVADGKQVLHAGNYTSYTSPVNLYGTSIPSSLLPGQIYVRY